MKKLKVKAYLVCSPHWGHREDWQVEFDKEIADAIALHNSSFWKPVVNTKVVPVWVTERKVKGK